MRDYKYVKTPKRGRDAFGRTATRRVELGRGERRTTRRRVSPGAVLTTALCIAAAYAVWLFAGWLTGAEVFQIAGVDVQGIRRMRDETVKDIAAEFSGRNIFRVDLDAAARQALANPWVKDVRIYRRLPNRISMVVEERTPRALADAANGRFIIDGEGTAIAQAPQQPSEANALPLIVLRGVTATPGRQLAAPALAEALDLAAELEARGGWRIGDVRITAERPETISIAYAGREFRMGSGAYPEKLRRLGEIVADMRQRGLAYRSVDLRPERQAAVLLDNDRAKARKGKGKG